MSRGDAPRILTGIAVATMIASIIGFVATMVLNALVFDDYDAYGEVPIPDGQRPPSRGRGDHQLPHHDHRRRRRPARAPHEDLDRAPDGVPDPVLVEDVGGTTTVNNDARVQV